MKNIKKILNNGLLLMLIPLKKSSIISAGFFVKTGSRNEHKNHNGIAHFVEHMMFKGTINRPSQKLLNDIDNLGLMYNAATTTQSTYYYMAGNANDSKKILDLLIDMYINSTFDTRELNKEKLVVLEEMRMNNDNPNVKLTNMMHKNIFKNTSLERSIIGNNDTIMSLNRKICTQFKNTYYNPNNTIFVVSGNFNCEVVDNLLTRALNKCINSELPMSSYSNDRFIILNNMNNQNGTVIKKKVNNTMEQVYFQLVFPLYDLYDTNSDSIDMLQMILGNGLSSRLHKALRIENGITYGLSVYPVIYSDCGLFVIEMDLNPLKLEKGLKLICKQLKLMKTEFINQDEKKKLIKNIKNNKLSECTNPIDSLVNTGMNLLYNKDYMPSKDYKQITTKNVDTVKINELSNIIFRHNKINLFIYGKIMNFNTNVLKL